MRKAISSTGFTLIELLVVVVISIVLLGNGLIAFSNFTEKRAVINAVDELKTYFQLAQTKTAAGDLGGCEQLNGYRVQTYLVGTATEVSLQAVCGAGTANTAQTFQLPAHVTVSPNIDTTFQVLNAGVTLPGGAASQDIVVANNENNYLFTLYREGRVSEGAWQ
ncbi:MAG: hypothetical protein UY13_C0001G0065 [Candidatus Pacebacteria bacterium GW2011_GWB1_47_8]|nr:MAG: hypothetical protein UX28_C0003G0006 [Candidatus Pacebacteria bacterium GW2011_GWA1_46_10]KKU84743.1 MAG: hypothetical protein UY13_C0001G0065 [Candidatus Pacebacteria bacterium GW2011_GWB1_47_8]HCR81775.1 hypothetical protein [Candidatus Paceibacterota bacterium]